LNKINAKNPINHAHYSPRHSCKKAVLTIFKKMDWVSFHSNYDYANKLRYA
jgi:hypothetical protein